MQVKKFEAPTIQEALDTIKRELGPEAIILQTKKHKRGFGLMNKDSVEVTAAVSERSLQKKTFAEKRLPEVARNAVKNMPAERQAEFINKYNDKHAGKYTRATAPAGATAASAPIDALMRSGARDKVEVSGKAVAPSKRLTATRYADIDEGEIQARASKPIMTMEEEVHHLKRMIEEMKTSQDSMVGVGSGAQALQGGSGSLGTPALQDAYEQLVLNGMDKRFAYGLMKTVTFELGEERAKNPEDVLDQVAFEIMRTTEVESPLSDFEKAENGPRVVALVGPTGVGKTTTVAKMASEALLRRNLKVGLINLDSYKVAAFDQLGTYAKILNVPFRSCANADDLRAAIQDFQSLDLIIVDTTGRSQRDPESLREMQTLLQNVPQIKTQLVLSVTTRDNELYDMANRFSMFRPQGIIVSKLDEATLYGSVYNVCQKVKLPLLYFTTGQRVPEDIEDATRERVAALILGL